MKCSEASVTGHGQDSGEIHPSRWTPKGKAVIAVKLSGTKDSEEWCGGEYRVLTSRVQRDLVSLFNFFERGIVMKTIITVIGKDKVGIIANVSNILAEENINISDISQTILQEYFTMIMVTQLPAEGYDISILQSKLNALGAQMALDIRVQHEAIFDAMHRI